MSDDPFEYITPPLKVVRNLMARTYPVLESLPARRENVPCPALCQPAQGDQRMSIQRTIAAELDRLRAELDILNKSHADLAHRLADCGRENEQLRETLKYIAGYVDKLQDQLRQKLMNQSANPSSSTSQDT